MGTTRRIIWDLLGFQLGSAISRQPVNKYLKFYQKSQFWTKDQILEFQTVQLKNTLKIVYQDIPLYREMFKSIGMVPEDISSLSDLRYLPISTKEMLRQSFPEGCTRKAQGRIEIQSTSGSTGSPFISYIDPDSQARARALMFLRAMMSGYRPGDRFFQFGSRPERGFLKRAKDAMLGVSYFSGYSVKDDELDAFLEVIKRKKLQFVMGNTQSLYLLANRAAQVGWKLPISAVVAWGSILFPSYRRVMESVFDCRVFDTYGISEGIQVSAQCEFSGDLYHQFSMQAVVEICNDGIPVAPGQVGDIIITRLNPGVMPFIRYNVGDRGSWANSFSCKCGRQLPLMGPVLGRSSDILKMPNGASLTLHFFSALMGDFPEIKNFRIIQENKRLLTIELVSDFKELKSPMDYIQNALKKHGGRDVEVKFELVNFIELESSGKQKFILSRDVDH